MRSYDKLYADLSNKNEEEIKNLCEKHHVEFSKSNIYDLAYSIHVEDIEKEINYLDEDTFGMLWNLVDDYDIDYKYTKIKYIMEFVQYLNKKHVK